MRKTARRLLVFFLLPALVSLSGCTADSEGEGSCLIDLNARPSSSPTPFTCDDTGP